MITARLIITTTNKPKAISFSLLKRSGTPFTKTNKETSHIKVFIELAINDSVTNQRCSNSFAQRNNKTSVACTNMGTIERTTTICAHVPSEQQCAMASGEVVNNTKTTPVLKIFTLFTARIIDCIKGSRVI